MTGARHVMEQQATVANNLSNVTTTGFRAQLETYRAVPLRGDGATTRVFAVESSAGYSDKAGPATRTGRNLDAMNVGNSWFAVQGLDGNEAYTRNGHFEVAEDGTLKTGNGLTALSSDGSPITVPAGTVMFTENAPCQGFPLVLEGEVKVSRHSLDGRSLELYRVVPGELCLVSSASLFRGVPMSAQGITTTGLSINCNVAAVATTLVAMTVTAATTPCRIITLRVIFLTVFDRLEMAA